MKKYNVVASSVELEAESAGIGIDVTAFGDSDLGPDPLDSSLVAEQAVKFDKATTAWKGPSGDGFFCAFYAADTFPLETTLPLMVESLDEFADE